MMKITVEIGKLKSELEIDGVGKDLLLNDIIPRIIHDTPDLKNKSKADVTLELLNSMLQTFVRQKATLWEKK